MPEQFLNREYRIIVDPRGRIRLLIEVDDPGKYCIHCGHLGRKKVLDDERSVTEWPITLNQLSIYVNNQLDTLLPRIESQLPEDFEQGVAVYRIEEDG